MGLLYEYRVDFNYIWNGWFFKNGDFKYGKI